MGGELSYLDMAEDDYLYFRDVYNAGFKRSAMCSLGQTICERYLKHVIEDLSTPTTPGEITRKASVMHTHSLRILADYIDKDMDIPVEKPLYSELLSVNSYYFSTRYPGIDSFLAGERDVDIVSQVIEDVRMFALDTIREYDPLGLTNDPSKDDGGRDV